MLTTTRVIIRKANQFYVAVIIGLVLECFAHLFPPLERNVVDRKVALGITNLLYIDSDHSFVPPFNLFSTAVIRSISF